MKLYTWTAILIILSTHNIMPCRHATQVNYVKQYENTTCPAEPCMTFEMYTKAAETYLVSGTKFVFLPGEHYYDGNLNLNNVTNLLFQGEDYFMVEHSAQITFTPGSNLTFIGATTSS